MRDVNFFTKSNLSFTKDNYESRCWETGSQLGVFKSTTTIGNNTRVVFRSQRSDGSPTVPSLRGTYYKPTSYLAFYSRTTPVPGRCITLGGSTCGLSQTQGRITKYDNYWADAPDWDGVYLGCSKTSLAPSIPPAVIASARNSIVNQVRNNKLDMGVFLGEFKETIQTVTDLARDIHTLLQIIRHPSKGLRLLSNRSLRQLAAGAARQSSHEYLRYTYGIRPLMSDMYAACSALSRGITDLPVGRAYVNAKDPDFNAGLYKTAGFPKQANIDLLEGLFSRGYKIEVLYRVTNPTLYQLQRYGVLNPLTVVWELTTLSFVADWFTGIGNFLSGLNLSIGLNYLMGYETAWVNNRGEVLHDIAPGGTVLQGSSYQRTGVQTKAMARQANVGFLPPPVFFRADLNLSQALSSLALLTQSFLKL